MTAEMYERVLTTLLCHEAWLKGEEMRKAFEQQYGKPNENQPPKAKQLKPRPQRNRRNRQNIAI